MAERAADFHCFTSGLCQFSCSLILYNSEQYWSFWYPTEHYAIHYIDISILVGSGEHKMGGITDALKHSMRKNKQ